MKTNVTEQKIYSLNLDAIKVKLMDENSGEGWSRAYADHVEHWYRRFLVLTVRFPNRTLVVNEAIDTFWHYHILDTRKYAEDCESAFGEFLHHFPYLGMRGDEDARRLQTLFSETLDLIKTEFDEDLEDAFGSRWQETNRPTRTGHARFKGAACSDCGGRIASNDAMDGRDVFLSERPRLVA